MKGLQDLVTYGKILSAGFLVGGYTFFGVLVARRLIARGYPSWLNLLLPSFMAVFGLIQGWLFVREVVRKK